MNLIVTEEQLTHIVEDVLTRLLQKQKQLEIKPAQQKNITGVEAASKFFEEQGKPISTSKIYKETAAGNIRCKTFGTRLVFTPADLLAWAESQTKDKQNSGDIDLAIARSARKKKGAAKNA